MENLTQIPQPKTLTQFEEEFQGMLKEFSALTEKLREKGKHQTADKFDKMIEGMKTFTENDLLEIEAASQELFDQEEYEHSCWDPNKSSL